MYSIACTLCSLWHILFPLFNYKGKLENESGDPIYSECEAVKGRNSTCKHVAAVLLVLQEFSLFDNLQIKKSCTEQLQTINEPHNPFKGIYFVSIHF